MVQQPVAQLAQTGRNHPDRCSRHDQEPEEPQQQQQGDGPHGLDRGNDRARGQEPDDAAGVTHPERTVGRAWQAGGNVNQAGCGDGQRRRADRESVRRGLVPRCTQEPDTEQQQGDRGGIGDPTEGPGDDGVDDLAGRALQPPPLAGGDQDGQCEQEQADAVAAVLRLELAGTVPDPAHGPAGHMGQAHPGGTDRPHRQACHAWPWTSNVGLPAWAPTCVLRPCVRCRGGSACRAPRTSDAAQG